MKHAFIPIALLLAAAPSDKPRVDSVVADLCAHFAELTDSLPGTLSELVYGTFHEDITDHDRPGCMLVISGSWRELGDRPDPAVLIFDTLEAEGWRQGIAGGDGPDGTFYILVKGDAMCIVSGRWDGGDDSDSTYVPSDVYQVVVICTPLQADDRRRLKEEDAERGEKR